MKNLSDTIKGIVIVLLVIALGTASSLRLMKLQIVGDEIMDSPKYDSGAVTFERQIRPTRGEILDYKGNLIVSNTTRCDLVMQRAYFPDDLQEGNKALYEICNALLECGYVFPEALPITRNQPYEFLEGADRERVTELLNLNVYATAENCIDKIASDYKISEEYSNIDRRMIAGMRYTMLAKDFSYSVDLTLAENVDQDTVVKMKELGSVYRGIQAVDTAERVIVRGDILPHEIGTVGPIYAEEYDELKEKGYAMNDTVGKNGIEKAMERELRGVNGVEEITVLNDAIVDVRTLEETIPGQTVKLTIDGAFQIELQNVLDNYMQKFGWYGGKKVEKGALVVLDAKTGALRGAATAPTYNLKDMVENYDKLLEEPNQPMFNRCTQGLYLPGSTFKPITATAGLNEGIVDGGTCFNCTRYYEFYGGHFQCTGLHGFISVRSAVEVSCNIYFYEVSRQLGIDKIAEYAQLYGLGSSLGLETGDAAGFLCTPEVFAERGQQWYIGHVIQAGIGNQDYGITPLQLANVACTIANRGVRYKPYMVDGFYTYGTNELIYKNKPVVAGQIELKNDYVYDYIIGGMMDAARNVPSPYSLSNMGFSVAIKTGTPQTDMNDKSKQNSVFIGFAPADNPEIAFAGVIEGGEYSKYMIRGIIEAYQRCYGLNGVKPTVEGLPPEVRNGTTEETTTTTTGTSSSKKSASNNDRKTTVAD